LRLIRRRLFSPKKPAADKRKETTKNKQDEYA